MCIAFTRKTFKGGKLNIANVYIFFINYYLNFDSFLEMREATIDGVDVLFKSTYLSYSFVQTIVYFSLQWKHFNWKIPKLRRGFMKLSQTLV